MEGTSAMLSPLKTIPDLSKTTPIKTMKLETFATSPGLSDFAIYPWKWAENAQKIQLSPSSTCSSPGSDKESALRRGRPRAEVVANLMKEGRVSCNSIRCTVCNRVFPREKSLQAHMRTHTGERPYVCDYPSCGKAFVQSGQLKTHQRLHTGEKPFVCTVPGCESRFTHANRHCPDHPFARLKREFKESNQVSLSQNNENNEEVAEWIDRYTASQLERSPTSQKDKQLKRRLEQQDEKEETLSEKKRARLAAKRRLHEQREKWYGALALIQLSTAGL